jgi:phosphoribosyl 1,2-cyclic phosphate phosphodiesterase
MTDVLDFTILGCGSSGGVPRANGDWGVCDPNEPKNRRSRCSLLVAIKSQSKQGDETTILIDTSPDLRIQTAAAGVRRLDAVLYTHDHADQAHGIDDLRAFAIAMRQRVPCFMDPVTMASLKRRFSYIFENQGGYPAICDAVDLPPHGADWVIEGPSGPIPVLTFDQDHGGVRSVGYRFADVAYCSDVIDLPPDAMTALRGLDVFVIDALRDKPHPTHANVARALEWIETLKPKRAILTNLHIDLDYNALAKRLPPGVEPAFDGLRFSSPISPPISDNIS